MIPVLASLIYGAAVWLIYDDLTVPPKPPLPTREGSTRRLLARSGLPGTRPRDFVLFSVACALAAGTIAQIWPGWGVLSLCAAVVGGMSPYVGHTWRERRRRERLQRALAEAIEQLRDSMRTKPSIEAGLRVLAASGPEMLRPEFVRLARRIPFEGFAPAVEEMRGRLAHPLADMLCKTLVFGDRLGPGQVTGVLEQLARSTRARMRVQEEIGAYQSKNVLSARIIALLPLVLLLLIKRVNAEYLAFYDTFGGQVVLLICAALLAAGYYCMIRLSRLPEDRRVLR
ncbi:MAG: hypothetical protein M3P51_02005 [Chloroflexota bacterium]|nr:hypothetical protein [Chloroflexota bacterium]